MSMKPWLAFVVASAAPLPMRGLVVLPMTFPAMLASGNAPGNPPGGQISERLRGGPTLRRVNRVGGSCLIGAGALTAGARRGS